MCSVGIEIFQCDVSLITSWSFYIHSRIPIFICYIETCSHSTGDFNAPRFPQLLPLLEGVCAGLRCRDPITPAGSEKNAYE